jgi:hypothetical protein
MLEGMDKENIENFNKKFAENLNQLKCAKTNNILAYQKKERILRNQ